MSAGDRTDAGGRAAGDRTARNRTGGNRVAMNMTVTAGERTDTESGLRRRFSRGALIGRRWYRRGGGMAVFLTEIEIGFAHGHTSGRSEDGKGNESESE